MESSHSRCACAAGTLKNSANGDVFNECGVKPGYSVDGAEDMGEHEFRVGFSEPAFLCLDGKYGIQFILLLLSLLNEKNLCHCCSDCADDDDVVVVLLQEIGFGGGSR